MRRWLTSFILGSVIMAVAPLHCHAADLKIIDPLGLTRAVRDVAKTARIVIVFEKTAPSLTVRLVHSEGLASDLIGVRQGERQYLFSEVSGGSWRIVADQPNLVVREVKIDP